MEILTNKIKDYDSFAKAISVYAEWCDSAYIVSPFYTDDTLLRIINSKKKNVTLIITLRYPTNPQCLRRTSSLGNNVRLKFISNDLHSKIYLFERNGIFKSAIGSSNLTVGGFYDNIETNVLLDGEDSEKLKEHFDAINSLSNEVSPLHIDEYESYFNGYEKNKDFKLSGWSTHIDSDYSRLWNTVNYIAKLVGSDIQVHFLGIPKYLVIDHFWHYIVAVQSDRHAEFARILKSNPQGEERYIVDLFKDYIKWNDSNSEYIHEVHRKSKRLQVILSGNNMISKSEAIEIFMTLHST